MLLTILMVTGAVMVQGDRDTMLLAGDTTFEVVATIKVPEAPHGICFSADGRLAYVACAGADRIGVLDTVAHELVGTLAAGDVPLDVLLASNGRSLLATQFRGDALLRVPLDGSAATRHLDTVRGRGQRVLITYGAGHKGWFLRMLRERDDVTLLEVAPFLDEIDQMK